MPSKLSIVGRMRVKIGGKEYELIKPYITGTNLLRRREYHVVPKGKDDAVLFTIQEHKLHKHCERKPFDPLNIFWSLAKMISCKPVWEVYGGPNLTSSTLIYYAVGYRICQKMKKRKDFVKRNKKEVKNLKMTKNEFWTSLVAFLSDFEHGVKKWFFDFFWIILKISIFFEVKR